jgi:hypothetical protein
VESQEGLDAGAVNASLKLFTLPPLLLCDELFEGTAWITRTLERDLSETCQWLRREGNFSIG